jgi:DMSO/TMAO reductase YedYZ molybdopterin-dependent catalytic subunit
MADRPISRGFKSRHQIEENHKLRLPPGQYVTMDFPVLSAGPTPQIKLENWAFALQADGSLLGKWSWEEFEALPQSTKKVDIHCVTKWSKLDTTWQGVTFDDLLEAVGLAKPPAPAAVVDDKGNLRVPADYRTAYQMLGSWAVAKDGLKGDARGLCIARNHRRVS